MHAHVGAAPDGLFAEADGARADDLRVMQRLPADALARHVADDLRLPMDRRPGRTFHGPSRSLSIDPFDRHDVRHHAGQPFEITPEEVQIARGPIDGYR